MKEGRILAKKASKKPKSKAKPPVKKKTKPTSKSKKKEVKKEKPNTKAKIELKQIV